MKTANWYKKTAFAALLSSSFLIFGSSIYQSIKVTDTSYMQDSEIKLSLRLDEEREVASAEREIAKNNVAIQYIPVNSYNKAIIDGDWIITRIEDERENELYNAEKENKVLKVSMKLEETSLVTLNEDEKYRFDVSFLHENNERIALFRSYGEGFEIIEAKKVIKKETASLAVTSTPAELEQLNNTNELSESLAVNTPLTLERAMVNGKLSIGRDIVSGSITVNGEQDEVGNIKIKNFDSMTVYIEEPGKEAFEFRIDQADLTGPGTFEVEVNGQQIAGIVTNNGKDAFRVRIASGPKAVQGALFNFVTDEELDRIEREIEEANRKREESAANDSYASEVKQQDLEVVQLEAQNTRKQNNVIDASFKGEGEQEYDVEEDAFEGEEFEEEMVEEAIEGEENMREVASTTGFKF